MIPTHHKAKLPKNLSYPLGTQAITEALAGAPYAAQCVLRASQCP